MSSKEGKHEKPEPVKQLSRGMIGGLAVLTAVVYFFSNPKPQNYYDYTFRVAGNLLGGSVGFAEKQPQWLNEFVPFEGLYYSVFPLGAVVSMVPFALLQAIGLIREMPGGLIAALLAGSACFLLLKIASKYELPRAKQILLTASIVFGTFMWTNLIFAGAWQLALGFAMLGELGAIYFTVYDRRPWLAGMFFAMAFGNRTENLLTAPVFLYLLTRDDIHRRDAETQSEESEDQRPKAKGQHTYFKFQIPDLIRFCAIPFLLGIATLVYNYVRFHSFTDFGYARIPGVLNEPWYDHGIFSVTYIPRQAWEMLGKLWHWKDTFPYLIPDAFSNSILLSSPFLLLVFKFGSRDRVLKYAAWAAIIILTFLLCIHGNSGGLQFGYRYAMILLPWVFVVLLETAPKRISPVEWALYSLSFAANAYATWLFYWTQYVKP